MGRGRPKKVVDETTEEVVETNDSPSEKSEGLSALTAASKSRLEKMAAVSKNITGIKTASEFVQNVKVVPTILPSFDQHIGGLPVGKLILVHGPSSSGKSPFVLALCRSYLERGHFALFIDAERATPKKWMKSLMGETYEHPGFTVPEKIGSYEDVRALVRNWCEAISEARDKGEIDKDTTGIIVLDSLKKLTPKNMWDELSKSVSSGDNKPKRGPGAPKTHIDGMGGRGGQIKASFNSAWVDELVPLLADCGITMVMITRESVEEGEGFFAKEIVKTQGGRHIKYDSALWLRIVDQIVTQKVGDDDKKVVGHKHIIEILRSKVRAMHDKIVRVYFHTSNGEVTDEGFDRVRDVFALGLDLEVINQKGAFYSTSDGEVIGQGEVKAIETLRNNPEMVKMIEEQCRSNFLSNSVDSIAI